MRRRDLLKALAAAGGALAVSRHASAAGPATAATSAEALRQGWKDFLAPGAVVPLASEPLVHSAAQWRTMLTAAQFNVLREAGTERAFTSPLNDEKRAGVFVCAGCGLPLFTSAMKYDSGTGWPSFFTTIPDAFDTKRDWALVLPRTEYHCRRCGGHHGHVFDDGPPPTGERWCNNGVALSFIPKARQGA